MINRPPPIEKLEELIALVVAGTDVDLMLAAHLTANLIAPKGSFVSVGPVSREVRVCLPRSKPGLPDQVWQDWPAWRGRWVYGPLDAAFGMLERNLPGSNYLFGRGRLNSTELPYACRLLFGMDNVLGQAEHNDGPLCVILSILDALLKGQQQAAADKKGAH